MPSPKKNDPADVNRGDNRSNKDRDGNRATTNPRGTTSAPDGEGRNPGVGHDEKHPDTRDRGDGTKRGEHRGD
jgi:hypothetical protein